MENGKILSEYYTVEELDIALKTEKTLGKQIKILQRQKGEAYDKDDMDKYQKLDKLIDDKNKEHAELPDVGDGYEKK